MYSVKVDCARLAFILLCSFILSGCVEVSNEYPFEEDFLNQRDIATDYQLQTDAYLMSAPQHPCAEFRSIRLEVDGFPAGESACGTLQC